MVHIYKALIVLLPIIKWFAGAICYNILKVLSMIFGVAWAAKIYLGFEFAFKYFMISLAVIILFIIARSLSQIYIIKRPKLKWKL